MPRLVHQSINKQPSNLGGGFEPNPGGLADPSSPSIRNVNEDEQCAKYHTPTQALKYQGPAGTPTLT